MATWDDIVRAVGSVYDIGESTEEAIAIELIFSSQQTQRVDVFTNEREGGPDLIYILAPICRFQEEKAADLLAATATSLFGIRVLGNDVLVEQASYLESVDPSVVPTIMTEVALFANGLRTAITGTAPSAPSFTGCASCGAERAEPARFCVECGSPFSDAAGGTPQTPLG